MNYKIVVFLLCTILSEGMCLDCYTCQYTSAGGVVGSGQNCFGPNVAASNSLTCANAADRCLTTVLRGTNAAGTEGVIISRTCGTPATGCLSGTLQGFTGMQCHFFCETNNCNTGNGSSRLYLTPTVVIISLLALIKHTI